jgi:hypothetical protein
MRAGRVRGRGRHLRGPQATERGSRDIHLELQPWADLTNIVIENRLPARIAKLARELPQSLGLDPRIGRELLTDPLLKRIQLRPRVRSGVLRRLGAANALRIVLRYTPIRRLISRIEMPSTRCNRLTSAHCSTPTTLPPRRSRTIQRESGPGRTTPTPRQVGHFSVGAGGTVFSRRPHVRNRPIAIRTRTGRSGASDRAHHPRSPLAGDRKVAKTIVASATSRGPKQSSGTTHSRRASH